MCIIFLSLKPVVIANHNMTDVIGTALIRFKVGIKAGLAPEVLEKWLKAS